MQERLNPITVFDRLKQGSEARIAQIVHARLANAKTRELEEEFEKDKLIILDNPESTLLFKLKESLRKILKPVGGRVAFPLSSLALLVAAACSSGAPREIHLQAEEGDGAGEFRHRGNASYNATVWLHEDESRNMEFKISKPAIYSVGVRYSNDGDSDNVLVSIDEKVVGKLLTIDTKKAGAEPGEGWNIFEKGDIAEAINLTSGKHKVEVIAVDTDPYGVEIDEVFLIRVDNEK